MTLDEVIGHLRGHRSGRHRRCVAKHQTLLQAEHAQSPQSDASRGASRRGVQRRGRGAGPAVYDWATGVALMAAATGQDDGVAPRRDLAYLCRALKAPNLAQAVPRLAERARAENWTHEEFLAACLEREVAARQSNGGEIRIRAARVPARKALEEFDFDHQRSLKREVIAHLGALDFIEGKDNVVFLGPPGTGKTHLAIGISIRACQAGHRVLFATAAEWVDRLALAHSAAKLHDELRRLGRYPLVVIDEVGYIPFEAQAANLFFQLVSARYERASVIVTSNKPFGRWGEVFGDATVAAAMIDRLVHHAEVVALKGDSYRLKDRDLGRVPTDDNPPQHPHQGADFSRCRGADSPTGAGQGVRIGQGSAAFGRPGPKHQLVVGQEFCRPHRVLKVVSCSRRSCDLVPRWREGGRRARANPNESLCTILLTPLWVSSARPIPSGMRDLSHNEGLGQRRRHRRVRGQLHPGLCGQRPVPLPRPPIGS